VDDISSVRVVIKKTFFSSYLVLSSVQTSTYIRSRANISTMHTHALSGWEEEAVGGG
jgi:hypothetical protein